MFYDAMLEHLQGIAIPQNDFRAIPMTVDWRRWREWLEPHALLLEDLQQIAGGGLSRQHLFDLRDDADAANWAAAPSLRFFLAVMIWGYTGDNRGPWRTAKALADAERVIGSLGMARQHLLGQNVPAEGRLPTAFRAFQRSATKIPWVNVSFFTKLMYFLGYDQMPDAEVRPVVFDQRVCLGLMRHALPYEDTEAIMALSPTEEPNGYARYCQWMHGWAHELGVAPDHLEWLFFDAGQHPE